MKKLAEIGIDRNKPIFFGCFNCRKAADIPITITLENPYKHEQPNWQTTWACDVCVKKLFKELGPDLVILLTQENKKIAEKKPYKEKFVPETDDNCESCDKDRTIAWRLKDKHGKKYVRKFLCRSCFIK